MHTCTHCMNVYTCIFLTCISYTWMHQTDMLAFIHYVHIQTHAYSHECVCVHSSYKKARTHVHVCMHAGSNSNIFTTTQH